MFNTPLSKQFHAKKSKPVKSQSEVPPKEHVNPCSTRHCPSNFMQRNRNLSNLSPRYHPRSTSIHVQHATVQAISCKEIETCQISVRGTTQGARQSMFNTPLSKQFHAKKSKPVKSQSEVPPK